jgi:DNA repair protein RadA/Sms
MAVLLGGDPGIGKSTLVLQAASAYTAKGLPVLYVTGEESLPQVKLRSIRLGMNDEATVVATATSLDDIIALVESGNYAIVMIDSIQTVQAPQLESPPGTVGQIRECANALIERAKQQGFALILVGHVTKEGMIAGPKVLEHMVDTVIYFEGDHTHLYRMLRVTKNRFGSVAEIGLFQMTNAGLVEVTNPSSFFLSDRTGAERSGAAVGGICEGNRPLLVEFQALVTGANYGNPQRVAGGIDAKRLALLLAVLEKRCDYPMGANDVFVSVAGGLRLSEPASDLPLLAAIVSSLLNKPIPNDMLVFGEVGLSGEIRPVTMAERRVAEAAKLGFSSIVMPHSNTRQVESNGAELIGVQDLQSALDRIFS